MRIDEALARCLLQLRANGRSQHTVDQAERHVLLFARWAASEGLSGDAADIGHEDVARFLASPRARTRPDGREKRAPTVNALRSSLRGFFGYLHGAGEVPTNAARLVRRARCGPPPPRGLGEDDERRLLEALAAAEGVEGKPDHAQHASLP